MSGLTGLFSGLEGNLEKYIEGFFKDKFKGRVQPVEIAKKLFREMRDRKRVSISNVYVPNEYTVYLNSEDWQAVSTIAPRLADELQEFLVEKAKEKSFTLVASPLVTFSEDNSLGEGLLRVEGRFGNPVTQRENGIGMGEAAAAKQAAVEEFEDTLCYRPARDTSPVPVVPTEVKAYLEVSAGPQEGKVFSLEPYPMIIGRRENCDIIITDSSVSRRHARVEYYQGSFKLSDLGSTNGTFVNGVRIDKKVIEPGDAVKFGSTLCYFKVE